MRLPHSICHANAFPKSGNADEYRRKLWDHLLIMSNFELDVDFPYEHVQARTFDGGPDPVPAERPGTMPYHHYGHFIPRLIGAAVDLEPGEERDALIFMIANQMKKTLLAYNPEGLRMHVFFPICAICRMVQSIFRLKKCVSMISYNRQLRRVRRKRRNDTAERAC